MCHQMLTIIPTVWEEANFGIFKDSTDRCKIMLCLYASKNYSLHLWSMKVLQCFWTGRINTVKVTVLPSAIYRLSTIPITLSMIFFTELE